MFIFWEIVIVFHWGHCVAILRLHRCSANLTTSQKPARWALVALFLQSSGTASWWGQTLCWTSISRDKTGPSWDPGARCAHSSATGEPDAHRQCVESARDLHHLSKGDAEAQPTPRSVSPLIPFCLQPHHLEFRNDSRFFLGPHVFGTG